MLFISNTSIFRVEKEQEKKCVYISSLIFHEWMIFLHVTQWVQSNHYKIDSMLRKSCSSNKMWAARIHSTSRKDFDYSTAVKWLYNLKWTPELAEQWQDYYNNGPRMVTFTRAGKSDYAPLPTLPKYKDLEPVQCQKQTMTSSASFTY